VNADTIRLLFTYTIAAMVLIGCFVLLVIPSQVGAEGVVPFVTGIVGIVLGFLFNRESTTSGQRASERAMQQGAATANTPTVTIQDSATR
jgi:membrane-bound ClpP family serine protease